MVFRYNMDEVGEDGLVANSAEGNYSFSAYVTNGVAASKGQLKCLTGFTGEQAYLCATNLSLYGSSGEIGNWNGNFSFVVWVRNPDVDNSEKTSVNRLIARGAAGNATSPDGGGRSVAWNVWISSVASSNGCALGVGLQDWAGKSTSNLTATNGVATPLTWKPDTWYQVAVVFERSNKTIKAYVSEEGSSVVGEPVASVSLNTDSGLVKGCNNVVIGAARKGYYGDASPSGAFLGEMREATLFKRQLTTEELLSDVKTFSPPLRETDEFATFHWNLDEQGEQPVAKDATANGFDGTTAGNVVGGLAAPTGTCYAGFSTGESVLYVDLGDAGALANADRSDIVLWVRRPEPAIGKTALLVGNMVRQSDPKASQPWRVFVSENGAVGISMQSSWHAYCKTEVGEPYNWGKDWHLVVVRIEKARLKVVGSGTIETCHRVRVYAAPAAEKGAEGDFTLVAETALQDEKGDTNFSKGGVLVFGAVVEGYYSNYFPQSILGEKGRIGEVAAAVDGWFDFDYLKSRLSRYYNPPKGFLLIIR